MDDIRALAAAIDADRIRHARRRTPPEAGFLDGARLFDAACRRMKAGLMMDFPEADDEEIERLLTIQIDRLRKFEEHGIYHLVEATDGE